MEGVTRGLLLLLAGLPILEASNLVDKDSPFYYELVPTRYSLMGIITGLSFLLPGMSVHLYKWVLINIFGMSEGEPGWCQLTLYAPLDWEGLQLGGMICAALMCIIGIAFALSGKCKCKQNQKHSPLPEKAVPLIAPGSASAC